MPWWGWIIMAGMAAAVLWYWRRQRNAPKSWSSMPQGVVEIARDVRQVTPAGAAVFSASGLGPDQLAAIDAGLGDAIRDARESGYTRFMDVSRFEIYCPRRPCEPSPIGRVPSFRLRADVYDGTEFDQYNPKGRGVRDGIGVILASEQVVGLGTPGSTSDKGQMIVCPDISHLREAVRNGADHILIANNNPGYFWATWYHGGGVNHPLLPEPSGQPATLYALESRFRGPAMISGVVSCCRR